MSANMGQVDVADHELYYKQSLTTIPRVATAYERKSKKDLELQQTIAHAQGKWNNLCELVAKTYRD